MIIQRRTTALVICVTGTDSLADWILDADMTMVDLVVDDQRLGRVHRGFLTYIMRLWPAILHEIESFVESRQHTDESRTGFKVYTTPSPTQLGKTSSKYEYSGHSTPLHQLDRENSVDDLHSFRIKVGKNKVFKLQRFRASLLEPTDRALPVIIFTGHSLGSCCTIAALMAMMMFKEQIKVRCITFASPKIGDREWVDSYTAHIARNFRVVHNHDIVSMLPLGSGYTHVNDEVRLGSNGRYMLRHRNLLWLLVNTTCCRLFSKCSGKLEEKLVKDHFIDRYIDAIQEAIDKGSKVNSALEMAMMIGSVDRVVSHTALSSAHSSCMLPSKLGMPSIGPPSEIGIVVG